MKKFLRSVMVIIQTWLLSLSKTITRKGLEDFYLDNLASLRHHEPLYVLNIGSGGPIAEIVKEGLSRHSQIVLLSLDIAANRRPDINSDAVYLPLPDNTFDCVVCAEVLEHIHQPSLCIEQIKRVLKPAGVLLLSTRFIYPLHDRPFDYFRFTKYGLSHLLQQADFYPISISEQHNWLETIAVLFVRTFREQNYTFRVMSWLVWVPLGLLLAFCAKFIGSDTIDFITSGYFVKAEA